MPDVRVLLLQKRGAKPLMHSYCRQISDRHIMNIYIIVEHHVLKMSMEIFKLA